ncbi:MAG: aspartate carbamoyltransferase regulatory subunit [Armatimonadetes bacterium]|nr:aspartate carbamoyltransferase regulatory subunit [Armatimonadota bacterium]
MTTDTQPEVDREFRVYRIDNGTVIDHIPHWHAYKVLDLLGLRGTDSLVTVGFGLRSKQLGRKDLLKIENRELTTDEMNRIALVAPNATINLVRDGRRVDKFKVLLPDTFQGLARCSNHGCITRHEPMTPCFKTLDRHPVRLQCHYCTQISEGSDIQLL